MILASSLVLAAALQTTLTVAILPVSVLSSEPMEKKRAEMSQTAYSAFGRLLPANGFTLVDPKETETALKTLGVDLTDEEALRRETFFRIGDALKADYVLFGAVISNGFFSANAAKVELKVWFLGVPDRSRPLSARLILGESKQSVGQGADAAQVRAAGRAAERAVEEICRSLNRTFVKDRS